VISTDPFAISIWSLLPIVIDWCSDIQKVPRALQEAGKEIAARHCPEAGAVSPRQSRKFERRCRKSAARAEPIAVTPENFVGAESDFYFSALAQREGGFGRFEHKRELSPIDHQNVIRQNRDTLYSAAIFDLDAGPVTVTLPEAGSRFMSMQIIDEDQYVPGVFYDARAHQLDREAIGTARYEQGLWRTRHSRCGATAHRRGGGLMGSWRLRLRCRRLICAKSALRGPLIY
jgi:hypothetical protein